MPAKKYATKEEAAAARKATRLAYYYRNHEEEKSRMRKRARERYEADPQATLEAKREWEKSNPESVKATGRRKRAKLRNDPVAWFCQLQRNQIHKALKRLARGAAKSAKTEELVGCTLIEFRAHIESQWKPGMSWDNYTLDGWHVDHIRPLASFDLADPAQQKAAFHYTNCQPLWAAENLSKNAKWEAA
jgi:hypothetical protein